MSLCKTLKKENRTISPQAHTLITLTQVKEASLCACHSASLTVEATVIIPMVAAFLIVILFFFRIIQVQAVVEEALIYSGRRTAVESSVVDSEVIQIASAEAFFLYALKDQMVVEKYVENGSLGIALLASEFGESQITLQANYCVKLPIAIFGIDGVHLWNRNIFRKWVGDMPKSCSEEVYVYITPNGEVYHATADCKAIKLTVYKAAMTEVENLRGLNGQKYYACSRCARDGTKWVYYTDYGDLYHGNIECSYIKRTIIKKALSKVEGRRECSLCY